MVESEKGIEPQRLAKMQTTYNEQQFDTGSVKLNYVEASENGLPLVLLHGATAYWQEMLPIIPALAERWHVYALDHRGHGKSGRAAGRYELTDYVADTIAFLDGVVGEAA